MFIALLIGPVLTVWEGYVLHLLWGWFVVPQFGLPVIGVAHAIGIAVLLGLVAHQAPSNIDDAERLSQSLRWQAAAPFAALLVGWIAKQFL